MADARLQVTIDAVDNASKELKSVEASLNRFGAQARQVGLAMGLMGGAVLAGMTLAIKSTADGQKAMEALGETTGKLKETVGQALVPAILQLNDVLKPMVDSVVGFIKEHPRLIQGLFLTAGAVTALGVSLFLLGTITRAATAAWHLFGGVLNGAIWIVNAMTGSQAALSAATTRAVATQIAQILLLLGVFLLAEAGANKFFKWIHAIPQETKPLWEQLADKVGNVAKTIMEELIPATAKFGTEMGSSMAKAAEAVQEVMDRIRKLGETEGEAIGEALDAAARAASAQAVAEAKMLAQLTEIAGPQLDAVVAKLVAAGLTVNEAWKVATLQVRDAIRSVMETMATGLGIQGQGILEALDAGTLSWVQAWILLGGEIEDVIALLEQLAPVGGLDSTDWSAIWAAGQAALAQNIADVAAGKFDEPALQHGGIVTRPTRALIGEAGPEAVIPLGSNRGGGLGMFNIYLQLDGRIIASILGGQAGIGEQVRSS